MGRAKTYHGIVVANWTVAGGHAKADHWESFLIMTWDEYYTQVLTLGIISGPVEGILTLCIVYIFTAIKGGGSFWHKPMLPTMGIPQMGMIPDNLYNLPFTSCYIIYGGFVLLFSTVVSVMHVLNVRRKRGLNIVEPLLGLLPVVVTWALIAAYLHLHPVILQYHLVPFTLFVGIINAYSVGRIIVAHLVKTDFPYQNILLFPLLFAVLDSAAPKMGFAVLGYLGDSTNQVAFVFGCLGLGLGVYGSFVSDVITTICDYLDIWCLTIKHPYHETMDGIHVNKGKSA
ncbi:Phosphotransferase [Emydomyces testavorans]|uniref:Phosphotransferase n=1 Tax=Emydomyces testavorans TaxID=2070801 RepID=A0AAF0DG26_9EURO|nr:Phosphotransferase [Emydomyces testavorans]